MEDKSEHTTSADDAKNANEDDETPILPRGWDYGDRFNDRIEFSFRGKKVKIRQSAVGSRVGATVWDIVYDFHLAVSQCK